jgi:hypothetical protein
MSEARTIWHALEVRRGAATSRQRSALLLAVCLLCAMAAAEVLFLRSVAGPDGVDMVAAEGVALPP